MTKAHAADPEKATDPNQTEQPPIQEYPKALSKPKPLKTDPVEYDTAIVNTKEEEDEKKADGFLDAEGRAQHEKEHAKAEEAKAKK